MLTRSKKDLLVNFQSDDEDQCVAEDLRLSQPSYKFNKRKLFEAKYQGKIAKHNFTDQQKQVDYDQLDNNKQLSKSHQPKINRNIMKLLNDSDDEQLSSIHSINNKSLNSPPISEEVFMSILSQKKGNTDNPEKIQQLSLSSIKKKQVIFHDDEEDHKNYIKQNQIKKKNIQEIQKPKARFIKSSEIEDKKKFSVSPLPVQSILKLNIKRDKSGFNHFWPKYDTTFTENYKNFISIKKKASDYYTVSTSNENFQKGDFFIGKIRSFADNSIFNILDEGINPSKRTGDQAVRNLLATIVYDLKPVTSRNPRVFYLYIMKQPYTYYDLQGINPNEQQKPLHILYENSLNKDKIVIFRNRKPIWCQQFNGFIMDFGGRIDKPSIKNFILQDFSGNEVLMFGRLGEDLFTCDISHPLSPLVAFGAILSNFDFKNNHQ